MSGAERLRDLAASGRLLEWASLGFVALPFLIFVVGWLRPWVAVPVVVVTLAGLLRAARPTANRTAASGDAAAAPRPADARAWPLLYWSLAAAAVVFVLVYSGTGGFAFQFGGHWRNNSFIHDLAAHPWPLGFESVGRAGSPGVLAFYVANAITPALVASWLGWQAGFVFQLLWTGVGVGLAIAWLMRVIGQRRPRWIWFFLLFGGLDIVGFWAVLGPYDRLMTELDLWIVHYAIRAKEMGHTFWIFPANLTILYNSPHHVLCSWIVLLMVVDDAVHRGTVRRAGLLSAFALLWSAFSFVGLAPFVLLALVLTRGRGMWSFENLGAGVCVLGVTLLYIGSNNGDYLHGPLWAFQDLRQTGLVLSMVCVIEFGIQAVLVRWTESSRVGIAHPAWLYTAVGVLLVLPWYRVGDHSDFTTKASIPALLVLQLCIAHALAGVEWRRRSAGWALVGALAVGAVAPVTLVARSVSLGFDASAPPIEKVAPTNELERKTRGGQLFSDGAGFFWRVLAKPIVFQPQRTE